MLYDYLICYSLKKDAYEKESSCPTCDATQIDKNKCRT